MGGQWMGASAFSAPASASFKCCWQNGLVESFNGKLRDELLNREWFRTLAEVRGLIEAWREFYNERRPHSALGCRPLVRVLREWSDTDTIALRLAARMATSSGGRSTCPQCQRDACRAALLGSEGSRSWPHL